MGGVNPIQCAIGQSCLPTSPTSPKATSCMQCRRQAISRREKNLKTTHASADKKLKHKRGGNLGEGKNEDERAKSEYASKIKRHKGNPKPQKGFGFPQHLRERKREKNVVGNIPNSKRKRERTANNLANRGQVLKGTKTNMIPTPETEKKPHRVPNIHPRKPNREADTNPTKFWRI